MKTRIIMKVAALLIAVLTIYIVVLWEPDVKTNNDLELSDEINNLDNSKVTTNEINEEHIDKEAKNTIENNNSEDNLNNNVISNDVVVAIDLESVIEKLTVEEKIKVKTIFKKLSVVDYSRFVSMLNNEDNNSGAVKAFALLKRRISTEDYKIIEGFFEEYIDFSIIGTEV